MRERNNEDDDYNKTHHVYADPLKLVQEIQNDRKRKLSQKESHKELNVKNTSNGTKSKSKRANRNELASTSSPTSNEVSVKVKAESSTSSRESNYNSSASSYANPGFKSENDDQRNDFTAKKTYTSKYVKSKTKTSEVNIEGNGAADATLDVSRAAETESLPPTSQTKPTKRTSNMKVPSTKVKHESGDINSQPAVTMVCTQSPETGERTCERSRGDFPSTSTSHLQETDSTHLALTSVVTNASSSSNQDLLGPSSTSKITKESPYAELPPQQVSPNPTVTVSPPEPPPPRVGGVSLEPTLHKTPDARSAGDSIALSGSSGDVEANLGHATLTSTTSISSKTIDAIFRRRRRRRMLLVLITLFLFFLLVGVAGVAIYLSSLSRGEDEMVQTSNNQQDGSTDN